MAGGAAVRQDAAGKEQTFLQLQPWESLILRTMASGDASGKPWRYLEPAGQAITLRGKWRIECIKGGPDLPPALETTELKSRTELGGEEAKRFGGTARYTAGFEAPSSGAGEWMLDLGDVRERARLNGREVAIAWSLPFQVRVGEFLKPGTNLLELEVTNLAANRIRDMDRRGVTWKTMHEINFVDINYKPFDASKWDIQPCGLLGPVLLVPMGVLKPLSSR